MTMHRTYSTSWKGDKKTLNFISLLELIKKWSNNQYDKIKMNKWQDQFHSSCFIALNCKDSSGQLLHWCMSSRSRTKGSIYTVNIKSIADIKS